MASSTLPSSAGGCRRRVRFAEEESCCHVVETATDNTPCHSESHQRSQVRVEAELLKPKGYGTLLKNCFDEKDTQAQKHINAFAKLPGNEYPRGLEVYLSRQHREACDQNHYKVTTAVLRRQRTLRAADAPVEIMAEKLRSVSKKNSRSSRVFARRLGIADAKAVREGDDLVQALSLVKGLNQGNAKMVSRKASVEDISTLSTVKQGCSSSSSHQGVAQMFGLAYMASRIPQAATNGNGSGSPPRKFDRSPVPVPMLSARRGGRRPDGANPRRALVNSCTEVIQDALDILDFSDEDDSSVEENNPAAAPVAKTA